MPRHKTYTQCRLRRDNCYMVSWIPTHLARRGLLIDLKEDDSVWTCGWVVVEVWTTKAGEQVEAAFPDYRHQRKMSDV